MSDFFTAVPFGNPLPPNNPHAVSVSLPLLQNVIDYEEGNEAVITKMQSGYPRFFQNKFVEKLVDVIQLKHQIPADKIVLPIASIHAKAILEYLVKTEFKFVIEGEIVFLILEKNSEWVQQCKDYIRNVGLLTSSRKAENTLFELNQITSIFEEDKEVNFPGKIIKSVLSKAYSNVSEEAILLTNSGMNALFTAYETIANARKPEGRTTIIQLGWLYVDTMEIIEKRNASHLQLNIYNKIQLEEWLEKNHSTVAALITEITTNPLLQCVDLPWLSTLCKKYNIVLIGDVTIATPFNVTVFPYCDIAVESLTKFACGNADVLMGTLILNLENKIVATNKSEFQKFIIPPFEGELQRLAFQIKNYESRVNKISQNTKIVYDYLKTQPFIKEIHSVFHSESVDNFCKIRKSATAFPGVLSVVFDEDLVFYYDQLQLPKGPSLGAEFTLAMPYVYLAHYNYLKTEAGKQKLLSLGINPNLLRISIGTEPVDEIITAFGNLKTITISENV